MIPEFARETALYFEPSAVDGLIHRSRKFAPHHVPLYQAVRARRIALGRFARNETASFACLRNSDLGDPPTLMLINDDAEQERGPAGWPLTGGLMQWAAAITIYDGPQNEENYHGLVILADAFARVVVVECNAEHAEVWRKAADATGNLVMKPYWTRQDVNR